MAETAPLEPVGHLLIGVSDDRTTAVLCRLERSRGGVSVHAAILRADRPPLVLVEVDVPDRSDRWEFRASGLWIDQNCEEPDRRWSYGLEAFGLVLDDPGELRGRGYGHRAPLGWELDFEGSVEAIEGPRLRPAESPGQTESAGATEPSGSAGLAGYRQIGRLSGPVLTAPAEGGEWFFDGPAERRWWPAPPEVEAGLDAARWPRLELHPLGGAPHEVALPLGGVGSTGPVLWVGHTTEAMTLRLALA